MGPELSERIVPERVCFLILAAVLSLTSCISTTAGGVRTTATPIPQPTATSNVPEHILQMPLDESRAIEDTAREGIDLWLGSYLGLETDTAYRLEAYRVKKVESVDDRGLSEIYDYVCMIKYDVSPSFVPVDWIAGDGRYGQDG